MLRSSLLPGTAGRSITVLVYLNDDFEGGETSFPTAGLREPMNNVYAVRERYHNCSTAEGVSVTPRRGAVLLFYSLKPNSATKDFFTWHGSCDVLQGEKLAANLWFHLGLMRQLHQRGLRPQSSPVSTEADEAAACVDSSANCAAWEREGQCDANTGFMLAECRRSCGMCGL